jgi:aminoglycoside phosphotransferase (APT) family kinase protein
MPPLDVSNIADPLQRFVAAHYGSHAQAANLAPMALGHAGLTYGFDVEDAGRTVASFVLRLAPPGVRRHGNTDVYRQAPLLRVLQAHGQPVPKVPWASPDEDWFGTPFIMMERLPGIPCLIWDPDPQFPRTKAAIGELWRSSARALAELHEFDWQRHLADWEKPRPLAEEVLRWDGVLAKAQEPQWLAAGQRVRELVLAQMPKGQPVGLIHGDYQPGNVLFVGDKLTGIVDWELSSIGAQLLDIGWMMMMSDRRSWHPDFCPVLSPDPEELRQVYQTHRGKTFADIDWYWAFAGYRFGTICCLNVRLHRTGKRPDPLWENFALAVPSLFGRAEQILRQRAST